MKTLLLTSFIVFALSLTSQVVQFDPTITDFPNLNPDSLVQFEQEQAEYRALIDSEIDFEVMSDAQKKMLEKEMFYEAGPFFTSEMGCSWYCAGGPSGYQATSVFQATSTSSYEPDNIHDFDLRTAWIENKEGYGVGEEIHIEFIPNRLTITTVHIFNGYAKSEKLWRENSRVKTMALYVKGELIGHLNLSDTYQRQSFDIGSIALDGEELITFNFRILDVYEGDKYKDTAISEINFDGTGDH